MKYLIREKNVPRLDLNYPKSEEEGVRFVAAIKRFLAEQGGGK
ncbi:MAG: DUF2112 family protein [Methanoregula sp.]|nr:DUF2112 family protein [Methanoregula sp.]